MQVIQVGTIPQVKVKRNRSLSIAAKISRLVGFHAGQVLSVVRDGEKVILEPVGGPNPTQGRLAACGRGVGEPPHSPARGSQHATVFIS